MNHPYHLHGKIMFRSNQICQFVHPCHLKSVFHRFHRIKSHLRTNPLRNFTSITSERRNASSLYLVDGVAHRNLPLHIILLIYQKVVQ